MKPTLDFSAMRTAPSMTLVEILRSYEGAILEPYTIEVMVSQVTGFFRSMEGFRLPVPSDNEIRATCWSLVHQEPPTRSPCMAEWISAYIRFEAGIDYEPSNISADEYRPIWRHVYGA